MRAAMTELRVFLWPTLVWFIAGGFLIVFTDQQDLHLSINRLHSDWADVFFRNATHLAEGLFAGLVIFIGFVKQIRLGVIGLIGIAGSGLFTQLLKRQVFAHEFRPSVVFQDLTHMHWVDGVDLHSKFSFPSGHATAAFAIFLFLGMLAQHQKLRLLLFVAAVLVAFSRVYISQHFFEDVYAGSMLGSSFTLVAYALLKDRQWGEKGLISYFTAA
jgi:membrane-associated phospholipid phosphatase